MKLSVCLFFAILARYAQGAAIPDHKSSNPTRTIKNTLVERAPVPQFNETAPLPPPIFNETAPIPPPIFNDTAPTPPPIFNETAPPIFNETAPIFNETAPDALMIIPITPSIITAPPAFDFLSPGPQDNPEVSDDAPSDGFDLSGALLVRSSDTEADDDDAPTVGTLASFQSRGQEKLREDSHDSTTASALTIPLDDLVWEEIDTSIGYFDDDQ